ncbi:ERG2/sigma1 receptor-like protein [Lactifluus volemus]|nr:ERG2/sigma1 receptor-like protein [Lactifluus volemus]
MASTKSGPAHQNPSDQCTSPKKKKPDPLTKWATRALVLFITLATFSWLDTIKDRWYLFDPVHLHELQLSALAVSPNDTAGMISHIIANLTSTYPNTRLSLNTDSSEWVFNNAGGAMGAMYVIHASITEYLIIFGTPLGTEGHSGLHPADDYFHILVGEQWAFQPGALEMERYRPGDVHLMRRGVAKQYKMHEGCWAMEYARGWIPLMMPFGLADTFTSTLDIPTLYNTVRITEER